MSSVLDMLHVAQDLRLTIVSQHGMPAGDVSMLLEVEKGRLGFGPWGYVTFPEVASMHILRPIAD